MTTPSAIDEIPFFRSVIDRNLGYARQANHDGIAILQLPICLCQQTELVGLELVTVLHFMDLEAPWFPSPIADTRPNKYITALGQI